MCNSSAHHNGLAEAPPCEDNFPFIGSPGMITWGKFYPPIGFVQGCTLPLSYSAGPRHSGDSHFPTGWPVNQHHFCKSPLLIFHRSDGLTHFVKYWVEWPASQVSFNLLFPEASNPITHLFLPIFPLEVYHRALCTLHVFRGYLFGDCIMSLWKAVWQWLQAQALESGCTASY